MHKRFGRKLTDEAFEDFEEALSGIHFETVTKVVKQMRQSAKACPTPAEVCQACNSLKEYRESKQPMLNSDTVCRYFDPQECAASKSLCEPVNEDHLLACRLNKWDNFCRWHYSVTYAKHFPGHAPTVIFVADMIYRTKTQVVAKRMVDVSNIGRKVSV